MIRSDLLARNDCAGVYFFEGVGTGLVKIGYGKKLKDRLIALQVGSPVLLCCVGFIEGADRHDERELHRKFKKLRHHGEWFRCEESLAKLIKDHQVDTGTLEGCERTWVTGDLPLEYKSAEMVELDEKQQVIEGQKETIRKITGRLNTQYTRVSELKKQVEVFAPAAMELASLRTSLWFHRKESLA